MNAARSDKTASAALHAGFRFENKRLTLKMDYFAAFESAVMISYSADNLPFATEFDLALTPSEYAELGPQERQGIKQLCLFWVRGFDFDRLEALQSLYTCQCCDINYWGLIYCPSLRYFGASEAFSAGCVDLRVLGFLGLSGVALSLMNAVLPDMLPLEFQYYDTGDTALFDRFNGHAVRLLRSDAAAQQLSADLYERFCRFSRANSSKLRGDQDARDALGRKYRCLKSLIDLRYTTRQCEQLQAELELLWLRKKAQTV